MLGNEYLVTIGIPVYNVEKYIRRCLESALEQSFESIEFLVIDDCGVDSSIDIVYEYKQKHSRGNDIRVVHQQYNQGIGNARNLIIDEAKGKYLYYLDSDDVMATNAIELLYNNAVRYDAQVVYGSYEQIEEFGEFVNSKKCSYPAKRFLDKDSWPIYVYGKYDRVQANVWNVLIKVDVLRKNNLRFNSINFWEDFVFVMDFPTYVDRAILLSDITYYYYCREGSLSNFQKRNFISKEEIVRTIDAVEELKKDSGRIRNKIYFPNRMYKLMVTDFYIVTTIFKKNNAISPSFSNKELNNIMSSPLSMIEILLFHQAKFSNLLLYFFWKLPPCLSVFFMKKVAQIKKLI